VIGLQKLLPPEPLPQHKSTMLPLAVLLCLMTLSAAASVNTTCGDIYFPSSLQPSADRFTVVTAGLTGTGKSTLVDMLAGGHEISPIGTVNGDSETEKACAYHFEFMGGANPKVVHERWAALDTPGFDDTGGEFKMMKNDFVVEHALRKVEGVDAILLSWKYDEKFTEANLGAFIELRSMFNADIWKRVVLVYTFWAWEDCVEFLCDCKKHSDLAKVHQDTMNAAFKHINRLAGDVRCNATITSDCFPEAKDIPYIGSDLTLAKLKRMRGLGCDPLVKKIVNSTTCIESCPVDAGGEIRRLRSILTNLTAAFAYQKLGTTGLTNYWASCEKARVDLQSMLNNCTDVRPSQSSFFHCPDNLAHNTALQLQQCIYGGIASETAKVATLLHGRHDLQANVAFSLTQKEYIAAPFFESGMAGLVNAYPNYATYKTCMMAADLNNQDVRLVTDAVTACWTGLATAEGRPRKASFKDSIDTLLTNFKRRGYSLRMAVALNMMHCQVDHLSCPGVQFVRKASSATELEELTSLSGIASGGRCCQRQGQTWVPKNGVCNNRDAVWNQTNIDCLRYCSLANLKIPGCSIKPDGEVSCPLTDAFGNTKTAKGVFLADTKNVNAYIRNGEVMTLQFDLTDQVHFVMGTAAQQKIECHQGAWQSSILWVLPKARQVRNCSVCKTDSECPSKGCTSGKGLQNLLWLAGESVHAELCSEPHVCGAQHDADCVKPPTCSAGFQSKDCSKNSCNAGDCCQKLGTCWKGFCNCPMRAKQWQPKYCKGPMCTLTECCEADPTVDTCSRATGGLCGMKPCESWRGDTECVHRGLLQWECQCKPGSCARNWGPSTGWCSSKCHDAPCSPDTGGYCDKTMAALGVNTCASWRGDTYCWAGRCICSNNVCASAYSEDYGNCHGSGAEQMLAANSSRYKPHFMTAVGAAFSAGLLAALSSFLFARRHYSRSSSKFADPLLRGEVLEEVQ